MAFDYTLFEVTVATLTPLHIGSGRLLLKDYDYAVSQKSTWRINEDALLGAQDLSDPRLAETLSRTAPAQLLKPVDLHADSPFIRYRLAGTPRSEDKGAQLQEQLKTVRDEAFLPGSSLKGAIRTALAWHGWAERQVKPGKSDLERNPRFAGRRLEQQIMGPDPNHDLLRALQVSDSAPAGKDRLIVLNAQVVTAGTLGSPIELEAVQADTPFHLTIKVDRALYNQWAKQNRFQLGGNPTWLAQIPQLIQQHTSQRLARELAWYQNRPGAQATASFYQQLVKARVPANGCLLQVGWGTGWDGKTFGSHLQADDRFMEYLINTYRLARGKRQAGDPFPKSRRSTVRLVRDKSGQTRQQPNVPLGWVLMEFKERVA
jgi:CRISPR-associated protein Csm5